VQLRIIAGFHTECGYANCLQVSHLSTIMEKPEQINSLIHDKRKEVTEALEAAKAATEVAHQFTVANPVKQGPFPWVRSSLLPKRVWG
jgi:hypothetical protein